MQSKFGFVRRRIYDVVTVLSAIGYCERSSVDSLTWAGSSNVLKTFYKLQKDAQAGSADLTLDEIVGCQTDVSVAGLTVAFILCFLALQKSRLDIKHVSLYLARHSRRKTTTLGKVYQISHILEAAGVMERSGLPREVGIVSCFFAPIELSEQTKRTAPKSLYSLEALLVHVDPVKERVLKTRAEEFLAALGREERAAALESGRFN
jgi:hypothetical protein